MNAVHRLAIAVLAMSSLLAADAPPPPAASATGASATAPAAVKRVSNITSMEILRTFAQSRGANVEIQGEGPVRIALVGGAAPGDVKEMLKLATATVKGLELWTGGNQVFARKDQLDGEDYILYLLPDEGYYTGLIDWMRGKGIMAPPPQGQEDVIRKVMGFPMSRLMVAKVQGVQRCPLQWSIYSTACMAIDAFYTERGGKKAPTWIREGLAAELQRIQTGAIVCTTIAYELKNEKPVENWPLYVAQLITKGDPALIPASSLMDQPLDAMPGATYRQIWSLTTYLRGQCGGGGKNNKLLRIMEATGRGDPSHVVVREILGQKDPALSQAWHQWAVANKGMK